MKLNIPERINLMQILPKESDYLTGKKLKELSDKLMLTDKEQKTYVNEVGGIKKSGLDYKVDISIGEICEKEIVEVLKKKNEEKKLQLYEISLYEKFVEKNFTKEQVEQNKKTKTNKKP